MIGRRNRRVKLGKQATNGLNALYPEEWDGLRSMYWSALQGNGSTLYDWGPWGNDATMSNFAVSDWAAQQGVDHRSDGDYLDFEPGTGGEYGRAVGRLWSSFGTESITLTAWVYMNAFQANDYITAIQFGRGGANPQVHLGMDRNGDIECYIEDDSGNQVAVTSAHSSSVSTAQWQLIGVCFDRIGDLGIRYLNGRAVDAGVDISAATDTVGTNDDCTLGVYWHSSGTPWSSTYLDGWLGDTRVYVGAAKPESFHRKLWERGQGSCLLRRDHSPFIPQAAAATTKHLLLTGVGV